MSNNSLSGTIPDIFGNFTDMYILGLSRNEFSGTIPSSFWGFNLMEDHSDKPFGLFLQENMYLTGVIPDDFCKKVKTTFQQVNIEFSSLHIDTSTWFQYEPNMKCTCCGTGDCIVWSNATSQASTTGTIRPACPKTNAITINYSIFYGAYDKITQVVHMGSLTVTGTRPATGTNTKQFENDICASPTGCYIIVTDTGVSQSRG